MCPPNKYNTGAERIEIVNADPYLSRNLKWPFAKKSNCQYQTPELFSQNINLEVEYVCTHMGTWVPNIFVWIAWTLSSELSKTNEVCGKIETSKNWCNYVILWWIWVLFPDCNLNAFGTRWNVEEDFCPTYPLTDDPLLSQPGARLAYIALRFTE